MTYAFSIYSSQFYQFIVTSNVRLFNLFVSILSIHRYFQYFSRLFLKAFKVFESITPFGNIFQSVADVKVKKSFSEFEVGLLCCHFPVVVCPCVTIIQFEQAFCSFWVLAVVTYFQRFDHRSSPYAVFK